MSPATRQYSDPPDIPGLTYVQPLGKGGYADVFLYEQQMPRMKVAVKVLMAEGLTEALRQQFTAEGNAMAQLADHPYIVQVFRAGIASAADGARPYLIMKYYPLPNMGVRARREQIPVAEVLSVGIQIASAVESAHKIGILHRDIKPANILTGQYGAPGLTDFGIAASKATADQADPEGMSIPWSPPEVLFASAVADERSDVYAIAATLWHLLVGRSPFEEPGGDNSTLALMRRIHDQPVPRTGRPNVPSSLDRLLGQAMAKDPDSRPSSALALARGLQQIEQEQGFPLTRIVVATDVAARPIEPDGYDATRVRAPVQITAQPIAAPPLTGPTGPSTAAPQYSNRPPTHAPPVAPATTPGGGQAAPHPAWAGHDGTAGSRWAPALDQLDAETVPRRARRAGPAGSEPELDGEPRRGVRPIWIAAGIAVIAAVMLAVGLAINANGSNTPTPTKTVPGTTDTNALIVPAPGTPTVTARRTSPTTAVFTWKYDNPVADDTFRVTASVAPTERTAKTPTITLTGAANQKLCISVKVYRFSGSDTSDQSAQVCAA